MASVQENWIKEYILVVRESAVRELKEKDEEIKRKIGELRNQQMEEVLWLSRRHPEIEARMVRHFWSRFQKWRHSLQEAGDSEEVTREEKAVLQLGEEVCRIVSRHAQLRAVNLYGNNIICDQLWVYSSIKPFVSANFLNQRIDDFSYRTRNAMLVKKTFHWYLHMMQALKNGQHVPQSEEDSWIRSWSKEFWEEMPKNYGLAWDGILRVYEDSILLVNAHAVRYEHVLKLKVRTASQEAAETYQWIWDRVQEAKREACWHSQPVSYSEKVPWLLRLQDDVGQFHKDQLLSSLEDEWLGLRQQVQEEILRKWSRVKAEIDSMFLGLLQTYMKVRYRIWSRLMTLLYQLDKVRQVCLQSLELHALHSRPSARSS